jgi:hypothetical protein
MDRVGAPGGLERIRTCDAERRDARSHAERGNEKRVCFSSRCSLRSIFITLAATLAVSPFVASLQPLRADEPPAETERIDPDGIKGALVICGGGRLPDSVRDKFIELAGGKEARLVVIPTASDETTVNEDGRQVAEIWKAREPTSITILHTRTPEVADNPTFVEPIRHATGVWITGGKQSQIAKAYSGTLV